jgi:FAD/FMN-containing dehydrogenase
MCHADAIVEPESTEDVAAALKTYAARAAAAGKRLKVRLTQRLFHSSSAFPCPAQSKSLAGGREGKDPGALAVLVVQSKLNKVLAADAEQRTLRVQPGMHLWDLGLAATAINASVPVGALPVFGGLTIGGAIAAGAHGSGDAGTLDTPMDFVKEVGAGRRPGRAPAAACAARPWVHACAHARVCLRACVCSSPHGVRAARTCAH